MLPFQYAWLADEGAPRMLVEALKLYGTLEGPGTRDNPKIVAWADEVAKLYPSPYNTWADAFYDNDGIPWCGLAMAVACVRAFRPPPNKYLSAKAWVDFGLQVNRSEAMLGDVLVFRRAGGGHVALYVGEDETAFHILGGNQKDAFNIVRKAKSEMIAVRRPDYVNMPANVRKIPLAANGALSVNEA